MLVASTKATRSQHCTSEVAIPKAPHKQAPCVAVAIRDDDDATDTSGAAQMTDSGEGHAIGPEMVKKEDKMGMDQEGDGTKKDDVGNVGGGVWGVGTAPGSALAKLIEEQE